MRIYLLSFLSFCIYPLCSECQGNLIQGWRGWREGREVGRALKLTDTNTCDELVDCPHDYYSLFNVGRKASPTELRKARKSLLLKLHPDKNKDVRASHAFGLAQKAYEELMDKDSRRSHDELLQWREYLTMERRRDQVKTIIMSINRARVRIKKALHFAWRHRRIFGVAIISTSVALLVMRICGW